MSHPLRSIAVDFNTLNSAPVDLVKFAAESCHERPPLQPGEHVLLYDADGLEVEATLLYQAQGWWLAAPDGDTWRDTQPTSNPLPSADATR